MANNPSARKRIRQNERVRARNTARVSRVRTFIKKVNRAIEEGNKEAAVTAFRIAQPEMQRAVSKGVFKKNTISRKLSNLSAKIKVMSA